jgi:hypothetical protein
MSNDRRRGARTARRIGCAALLALALAGKSSRAGSPTPATPLTASDASYTVTALASRQVPNGEFPNWQVNEVTLQVVAKRGDRGPRTILFGGPEEVVREDLRDLRVVSGQLIAATDCSFAVYDLASGSKRAHVYSSCSLALSPDGRRVAYVERLTHFMPAQATGSVIRVLDVVTLVTATVFPDPSEVSPIGGNGSLLSTWEDDLTKVHDAGALHWSPDSQRLVFFCIHGLAGHWAAPNDLRAYLVTVALADLKHTRFAHRPVVKEQYLLPGIEPPQGWVPLHMDAIEWLPDGGALHVIPRADQPWMRRDIVLTPPQP